jgi:hypothetical protein
LLVVDFAGHRPVVFSWRAGTIFSPLSSYLQRTFYLYYLKERKDVNFKYFTTMVGFTCIGDGDGFRLQFWQCGGPAEGGGA